MITNNPQKKELEIDLKHPVVDSEQMLKRLLAFSEKIPSNELSLDGDILVLSRYLKDTPTNKWSAYNYAQLSEYYRYICTLEHPCAVKFKLRSPNQICKVDQLVHYMGKEDGQVYLGMVTRKVDYNDIWVTPFSKSLLAWQNPISIHLSQIVEYGAVIDVGSNESIIDKAASSAAAQVSTIESNKIAPSG